MPPKRTSDKLTDNITASQIACAKGAELKFWIDEINKRAGERILNKTAKNLGQLRERIAQHLKLNISKEAIEAEQETVKSETIDAPLHPPTTRNREIQQRQWKHVRDLGRRYQAALEKGEDFALLRRHETELDTENVAGAVSTLFDRGFNVPLGVGDWFDAAAKGDSEAVAHLTQLGLLSVAAATQLQVPVNQLSESTTGIATASTYMQGYSSDSMATPLAGPSSPIHTPFLNHLLRRPLASDKGPQPISSPAGFTTILSGLRSLPMEPELAASFTPQRPNNSSLPLSAFTASPSIASLSSPCASSSQTSVVALPYSESTRQTLDTSASRELELAALKSCELDIQSLASVDDLRDVIHQLRTGEVQRIRDKYGPKGRRGPARVPSQWRIIKGAVNKRERVGLVLTNDFHDDEDTFYKYFSYTPTAVDKRRKGRLVEGSEPGLGDKELYLRPYRRVAEAIPHCAQDIKAEKRTEAYRDPATGKFSAMLWSRRWGDKNNWEVWRAIGKEHYT